jgi:hypothetical protein
VFLSDEPIFDNIDAATSKLWMFALNLALTVTKVLSKALQVLINLNAIEHIAIATFRIARSLLVGVARDVQFFFCAVLNDVDPK